MKRVDVTLPHNSYSIWIGPDMIEAAAKAVGQRACPAVAVVSDKTVWALHGQTLTDALRHAGVDFTPVIVAPGEGSKSLSVLAHLYQCFADAHVGRDGLVVAFGGGVVGDLAGFAAATWMRGVPYMQLPTTLLSQIDSSVGGKTAINLDSGKNLAGAFYQPCLVAADTGLLQTLPARELRCGLAEMIKYGAIFSCALFDRCGAPMAGDVLPDMIQLCCQLKSQTVQADEKDRGQRMLLNFGHTFGHAIEKLGGFETHNHGEAVAVGMMLASAFGEKIGFTKAGCRSQLSDVLHAQGLPTQSPYGAAELLEAMGADKKSRKGGVDLILLRDIGQAEAVWHAMGDIEAVLKDVV